MVHRMKDSKMLELLQSLEPGVEIEIDIMALDGLMTLIGKYKGGLQQDGYYKGGSWINDKGDSELWNGFKPCYKFYFQEKGKRKIYIIQVGYRCIDIRKI